MYRYSMESKLRRSETRLESGEYRKVSGLTPVLSAIFTVQQIFTDAVNFGSYCRRSATRLENEGSFGMAVKLSYGPPF